MWKDRFAAPVLVAFLSLGFMSQSPFSEPTKRRIAGIDCVNCGELGTPLVASPLPPHLAQYLLGTGFASSSDLFASFARNLELQAQMPSVNPILIAGSPAFFRPFGPLPTFPGYALPSVTSYQVSLVKPDSSKQIFGGLMSDPALRHLISPAPVSTTAAITVGTTLGAQDLSATLGGDLVVPKAQNRLPQNPNLQSSTLLGSKPVPKVATAQVEFTVNGGSAPAGFFRAPGSPAPRPVAATEPNNSPNPVKDAVIRHSFVK